jgi:hypothetical protein
MMMMRRRRRMRTYPWAQMEIPLFPLTLLHPYFAAMRMSKS